LVPKGLSFFIKNSILKPSGILLHFFPFRYIDRTKIYSISEIEPSMSYIQLRGRIIKITQTGERGRSKRLTATFTDNTGSIELVFFQGIKWIKEWLKPNTEYIVFGKPTQFNNSVNIVHPEVEAATEENPVYVGNMIGVYPSTERLHNSGIGNKQMAKLIATLLKHCVGSLHETIPDYLVKEKKLLSYSEAIHSIHFPKRFTYSGIWLSSVLKFEELFYLQLSLLKQKTMRVRVNNGYCYEACG
jgi:ATP-dependent DNA helicase RecG